MSQIPGSMLSCKLHRLAGLLCILLGLSHPALVGAASPNAPSAVVRIPNAPSTDRMIVHYRQGVAAARTPAASALAASFVHDASNLRGYIAKQLHATGLGSQVWQMDKWMTGAEASALARDIAAKDSSIEFVEPDQVMAPLLVPNDTYYPNQWSLNQLPAGINVEGAWNQSSGAGVVVAIVDSGYRPHSDLAANILAGYDFISDASRGNDGNGRDSSALDAGDAVAAGTCSLYPSGTNSSWHGTLVSGIVSALTNNGAGVAGVAYSAKILPVRVLGRCGGYSSDIADGILWASGAPVPGAPLNYHPARVINLSLGGPGACSSSYRAAISGARSRGAVVIAAAGNDTIDVANISPANCPGVLAVAAIGQTGARWSVAPSGPNSGSNFGQLIALSAPGAEIWTTTNLGTSAPAGDSIANPSGTSFAAPHVSGVAALMLSTNPALRVDDLAWKMINSTRAFPVACAGCGSGLLDATNAVNSVVGYAPSPIPLFAVTRLSDDLTTATWRITNTRNAPVQLTDLYLNISGIIIRYGQIVGMGPTFLSTTCVPGSWIGPGGTCNVSTNDGELCGGQTSYVLSAANSTGVGVASESAFVGNASCGGS